MRKVVPVTSAPLTSDQQKAVTATVSRLLGCDPAWEKDGCTVSANLPMQEVELSALLNLRTQVEQGCVFGRSLRLVLLHKKNGLAARFSWI